MRTITFWLSLLFLFTIPWEELVLLGNFGTLGRLVGVLLAACWGATVVITNRIRKPQVFHAIFCLFILWHVLSVMWSIDVDMTVGRLQAYVQLIVMVYIIWDLYTTPAAISSGLQAYVLGAYVAIGSLMSNYFAGSQILYGRYTAEGFDPNNVGIIMALGIAPAWYLATGANQNKIASLLKVVNYIYIPSAIVAILLTGSRGALLATSAATLYIILGFSRLKLVLRTLVFLALIGSAILLRPLIPSETMGRLGTTVDQIESLDLNGRYHLWALGLTIFTERPLLGVGSFAFRTATDQLNEVAHNSFLTILVEVGLFGFSLFTFLMAITIYKAVQHKQLEARLWLAILAILMIGSFSLNWAHRKQFWVFPALVVASACVVILDERKLHKKRIGKV